VAKATGRDVVAAAVRCALGATLESVGWLPGLAVDAPLVAVKAPVGSLWRLPGVDVTPGPEMRSTGEVLGLSADYAIAVRRATEAVAAHEPRR
jgi:carbamoyl-phosphate synthase large subunit